MQRNPFGAFAKLEPKPPRFNANVSIKELYRQAGALAVRAADQRAIVRASIGIDLDRAKWAPGEEVEARDETVDYAIRIALQKAVESGALQLFVCHPIAVRFFALPCNALAAPPMFLKELGGQVVSELRWVPRQTWTSGVFAKNECDLALVEIAEAEFPIFTTTASVNSALAMISRTIRDAHRTDSSAEGAPDPGEDLIAASIRSLAADRAGSLPLNDGARLLMDLHPELRRDEARARIKQVLGSRRPGPVGPRRS
jgi:hypothetical protein